jgi:putative FmdB family regulatory protein
MPLYEYLCPACHERFELLQRVGESGEAVACPACGANGVARQLSTFAAAVGGGGAKTTATESFGCGRPQCAGGSCAGLGDWN